MIINWFLLVLWKNIPLRPGEGGAWPLAERSAKSTILGGNMSPLIENVIFKTFRFEKRENNFLCVEITLNLYLLFDMLL